MAFEKTTRELLEDRITGLQAERQPFEQDWEEIGRLCSPYRVNIKAVANTTRTRRSNTTSQDTSARKAVRRLVNGMATGLTSASRPWFKLTTRDPELRDYQPVKEWLDHTEREIYAFLAKTNYYDTTKVQYADLGPMGVGAAVCVEHDEYGAVYHHAPVGTYHLGIDSGLRLSCFVREAQPTVGQMFEIVKGDRAKLSNQVGVAYDKGDYSTRVPVVHVIERNTDAKGKYISPKIRKPWRSIRWEVGNNDKKILVTESGYESQPVTAPRWETVGDQIYCDTSPGFDALPDMRELQLAARRASRAMDNLVKPALMAAAGLSRMMPSLDPGTINFTDALTDRPIRPILDLNPNTITVIRAERQEMEMRVNELFYADLFMAITEMEGVQPRNEQELFFRNEEKLTQLGPVVDRVTIEKLEVDIERAFTILKNLGRLPPIPDELTGKPLEIEFISVLAQAQKVSSSSNIERAARYVGFIAGMFPDAAIKFDAEQSIDEFAAASGTTPTIIRSDEVVAQMKEAMAQQKQQEQMAAMAQPMKDAATGAKLLSETQVDDQGTSALARMLGQ